MQNILGKQVVVVLMQIEIHKLLEIKINNRENVSLDDAKIVKKNDNNLEPRKIKKPFNLKNFLLSSFKKLLDTFFNHPGNA